MVMVTFTCGVTRWTVVAFCKNKDEILDAFLKDCSSGVKLDDGEQSS